LKNRNIIIAVLALCALALLSGCVRRGGDDAVPAGSDSPPAASAEAPAALSSAPPSGGIGDTASDGTGADGEETAADDGGSTPGGDAGSGDAGSGDAGSGDAGSGDAGGGTEMEETDDILDSILRQLDELEDIYSEVEGDDVSDDDLTGP
jgi:hypothetical protein